MKCLFNCTTNIKGGGIKNSALFIRHAYNDRTIEWHFALSPQVKDVLDEWCVFPENCTVFEKSPARSQVKREQLRQLAKKLHCDLVLTMAGPAYTSFDTIHVMGLSNAYITHPDLQSICMNRSIWASIKTFALIVYMSFYSRRADHFLFQTQEARVGFCKRLFIPKTKTKVVPNAIGDEFMDMFCGESPRRIDIVKKVKIFCPAAAYWHKALQFIPGIALELKAMASGQYTFEFILTLDKSSALVRRIEKDSRILMIEDSIRNIGPFNYANAPKLYKEVDLVFVPSILETFSAGYLEAFASSKPLIVADKSFSRSICSEGALYVNPLNASQSAAKIHGLIQDGELQMKLIAGGTERLKAFGNQMNRYQDIKRYLIELKI